jgi:hypothetical protein
LPADPPEDQQTDDGDRDDDEPDRARGTALILAGLVAAACIAIPAIATVRSETDSANTGLAGGGGTPGGRAAAQWIGDHAPADAAVMTIGPSMANIVQFYGDRSADGLSVSPNPLHRNPTDRSIGNANAALRAGKYQYVVWDAYSAARSPNFGTRAEQLVQRFGGQPVDVQRGTFRGKPDQPLVIVYELPNATATSPTARPAVAQPSRAVLYAGYAVMFVIAAGIGVVALVRERTGGRRTPAAKDT